MIANVSMRANADNIEISMRHMTKSIGADRTCRLDLQRKTSRFSIGILLAIPCCLIVYFSFFNRRPSGHSSCRNATDNAIHRLNALVFNYIGLEGKSCCLRSELQIYKVLMSPYENRIGDRTDDLPELISENAFVERYFQDGWGRILLVEIVVNEQIADVHIVSRGEEYFDASDDIIFHRLIDIKQATKNAERFRKGTIMEE